MKLFEGVKTLKSKIRAFSIPIETSVNLGTMYSQRGKKHIDNITCLNIDYKAFFSGRT